MRKFFAFLLLILLCTVLPGHARDISPLILTVTSYPLSEEEKLYIQQVNPYGFVFVEKDFRKGIDLFALKSELNGILDHKIYFFVDQEGGTVNRLKYLFPEKKFPSAEFYGNIAEEQGLKKARDLVFEKAKEMATLLSLISVDVNFSPNAEIRPYSYNGFFRSRLYSEFTHVVTVLSHAFAEGTKAGGVEPCYKHFPGTAMSQVDPHKGIPVIKSLNLQDLERRELIPFAPAKNYKYIMMGHALYPQIDPQNITTFSPIFYQLLREKLQFEGLIITDALNMKATGAISIGDKIANSLSAGADLAMPFFDDDMPFDKRLQELNKIPPGIIKKFNKKINKTTSES